MANGFLIWIQVLAQAQQRGLLSDEHFTVDGTLIEAWAGQKSFKRKEDSEQPPPPEDPGNPSNLAQNPIKLDLNHYKVEFENDQIRYGPRQKSVMHEHSGQLRRHYERDVAG